MKKIKRQKKKGFTLVEVIVVLVILAVLAAILIPSLIGYIDKSNKKAVIAECRYCVTASQTLISEKYGESKSRNKVNWIPTSEDIEKLAEVEGTVNDITVTDINNSAKLMHLTYQNKDKKYTVVYCADYRNCSDHKETYTVTENGKGTASVAEIIAALSDALNSTNGFEGTGVVDSEAITHKTGSNAERLYNALPQNIKRSLEGKSWMIKQTGDRNTYSIYVYEGTLNAEMVNGPMINVTQYNYSNGSYTEIPNAKKYVRWNGGVQKDYLVLR